MQSLAASRRLSIVCAALLALIFALDVATPQLLVVAILANVPIALSSVALRARLTVWLVVAAELTNVIAAYADAWRDGAQWSGVAIGDRLLLAASFVLVGALSVRAQRVAALSGVAEERRRSGERERDLRRAVQRIGESLSPEIVSEAIEREATRLVGALRVVSSLGSKSAERWPLKFSPTALRTRLEERGVLALALDGDDPVERLVLAELESPQGVIARVGDEPDAAVIVLATAQRAGVEDVDVLASFAAAAATALQQANLVARLDEHGHAIERQKDQLAERNGVIRDIVYALAHDLRTPVRAANVTMQQAIDGAYGELPDAYREILRTTIASNYGATRLVDTLLMVARYESGDFSQRRDAVDMGEAVERAVLEIAPLAEARQVRLARDGIHSAVVEGDAMELRRAVVNLLANAVTASPAQASVAVNLAREGTNVTIAVADRGYGVPVEQRAGMFERFASDARRPGSGTGLGLYIVRKIVERHGGTIAYESLNPGSRFVIALPESAAS